MLLLVRVSKEAGGDGATVDRGQLPAHPGPRRGVSHQRGPCSTLSHPLHPAPRFQTCYTREAVLDAQNTAALVAATSKQVSALAMKQQKVTVDGMVKGLKDQKKRKFGWFDEESSTMDWAEVG